MLGERLWHVNGSCFLLSRAGRPEPASFSGFGQYVGADHRLRHHPPLGGLHIVKNMQKSRGIDVNYAFKEIPPE
jgi:hypothetical protein